MTLVSEFNFFYYTPIPLKHLQHAVQTIGSAVQAWKFITSSDGRVREGMQSTMVSNLELTCKINLENLIKGEGLYLMLLRAGIIMAEKIIPQF